MPADPSGRQRPHSAVAHLLSCMAILLVVVPLALNSAPPAAPQVAEFAPQVQQIKDPPKEQAANVGKDGGANGDTGTGGSGDNGGTPPPTPTPSSLLDLGGAVEVPLVKRCYGNPPRQTEDPQSPPCVPYFKGDNGGATYPGVTADTIRVGVPSTVYAGAVDIETMTRHFNSRYQFYGRRIKLVPVPDGGNGVHSVAQMNANAAAMQQANVFAVLGYPIQDGEEYVFYNELARRKILSVQWYTLSAASEKDLEKHAPYEWAFQPAVDDILRNYGQLICRQLRNKPPAYGGPFSSPAPVRKFGYLRQTYIDGSPAVDMHPLTDTLSNCGVPIVGKDYSVGASQTDRTAILAAMQQAGVTSILPLIDAAHLGQYLQPAATGQGYFPEWWASDYILADNDDNGSYMVDKQQASHTLGLMSNNKFNAAQDSPSYWAGREIDPAYAASWSLSYPMLLTLSSGIQLAGPRLTPQAFQDGLYNATFPDPGAGAAPYYQAGVGFGPLDHTMVDDFAPVWWSNTDPSPFSAKQGTYCYVDRGVRYGLGEWPDDPRRLGFQASGTCR